MKVFISWSGDLSKQIAEVFHKWLKGVIQFTEPWISEEIDKGAKWETEISEMLRESKVGIICLTPDNLDSNWLLFEAGAISSNKKSKVCTLLWELSPSDIKPPLERFNHTKLSDKGDIFKLLKTVNSQLDNPLNEDDLKNSFDVWWPKLEEKIKEIKNIKQEKKKGVTIRRTERELLEEILENTRQLKYLEPPMAKATVRRNFNNLPSDSNKKEMSEININLPSTYNGYLMFCPHCGSSNISVKLNEDVAVCFCKNCGTAFKKKVNIKFPDK